ncbi:hypothetical protein FRC03_000468 [Tulasnella sp. 419]|nr:hypothetical protein FRC03_000468 [Tulasnella sp. 419]
MPFDSYPYVTQALPYRTPPEVFLQIFHWATLDETLLSCTPSWRHWDLNSAPANDCNDSQFDPWPKQNQEALNTARSLSVVCRAFRNLSYEFLFRHIILDKVEDLAGVVKILGRKDLLKWVKRLSLFCCKEGMWTRHDSEQLYTLLKRCPNIEVLSNSIAAFGVEDDDAGPSFLQQLFRSCKRLKRLHWNPLGCMSMDSTQWTQILSSNPTALYLQALEILGPEAPDFRNHIMLSSETLQYQIHLPNLHSLRLCANEDFAFLLSTISTQWQIPKLSHLSFRATKHPCRLAIEALIASHGENLISLYLDENTCYDIDVTYVVQCTGKNFRDLCIHDTSVLQGDGLPVVENLILVAMEPTADSPLGPGNLAAFALQPGSRFPADFQNLKRVILVNPDFPSNGVMMADNRKGVYCDWYHTGVGALQKMTKRGIQVVNWYGSPITFKPTRRGMHLL